MAGNSDLKLKSPDFFSNPIFNPGFHLKIY